METFLYSRSSFLIFSMQISSSLYNTSHFRCFGFSESSCPLIVVLYTDSYIYIQHLPYTYFMSLPSTHVIIIVSFSAVLYFVYRLYSRVLLLLFPFSNSFPHPIPILIGYLIYLLYYSVCSSTLIFLY